MSDNDSILDYDENDLINSPLSQVLQEDNEHLRISSPLKMGLIFLKIR